MSTAPAKHQFVVWAPDYTDSEALNRRLAVRPQHIQKVIENIKAGIIKTGGVTISPETYLTESKRMNGSMLIVEAESVDAVKQLVAEDVYWSGNVWDKEKIVISPFAPAQIPKE
ncbi:hypothetical protein EUX98_g8561 [Antrodiella citrinella]|uniref:YCII-related domain-containing protein n=1 Tax=Antrodiella citrinella TaxID=2447956 RepID=A0A4S4M657_9APHY|nr:hypothetical protein EUX98_g8561 [Antrodiella citrinella]